MSTSLTFTSVSPKTLGIFSFTSRITRPAFSSTSFSYVRLIARYTFPCLSGGVHAPMKTSGLLAYIRSVAALWSMFGT